MKWTIERATKNYIQTSSSSAAHRQPFVSAPEIPPTINIPALTIICKTHLASTILGGSAQLEAIFRCHLHYRTRERIMIRKTSYEYFDSLTMAQCQKVTKPIGWPSWRSGSCHELAPKINENKKTSENIWPQQPRLKKAAKQMLGGKLISLANYRMAQHCKTESFCKYLTILFLLLFISNKQHNAIHRAERSNTQANKCLHTDQQHFTLSYQGYRPI